MERLDRAAARVEPVFVAVAAIAAAAVILFVTGPHGPALSPDSAAYLSAAESFADGEGLTKYGGEVMVNFPPGFPLLLAALVELFEASAVAAGRVANAVLLGLITGAAWLVLRRLATSATIRLLGVTVVASATSLHLVSSYAWSEPLFVFTSLFALLALNEAIRRPYDVGWLVVAALAAGSCFLIRYIGVVLIVTGSVAILVGGWRQLSGWRRLTRAAVFAVVASAGPVAWVVRNLSVSDTTTGGHGPAEASLAENAYDAVRGVGVLLVPEAAPVRGLVLLLLCAVAVAAVLQVRSTGLGGARRFAWLLAGFVALYVVVLVVSASTDLGRSPERPPSIADLRPARRARRRPARPRGRGVARTARALLGATRAGGARAVRGRSRVGQCRGGKHDRRRRGLRRAAVARLRSDRDGQADRPSGHRVQQCAGRALPAGFDRRPLLAA